MNYTADSIIDHLRELEEQVKNIGPRVASQESCVDPTGALGIAIDMHKISESQVEQTDLAAQLVENSPVGELNKEKIVEIAKLLHSIDDSLVKLATRLNSVVMAALNDIENKRTVQNQTKKKEMN